MASIIQRVDIKGDKKPQFIIRKGTLAELKAFVDSGMRVDLHIAIQPPPSITGMAQQSAVQQVNMLEQWMKGVPHEADSGASSLAAARGRWCSRRRDT